jgi:hypothetical protein
MCKCKKYIYTLQQDKCKCKKIGGVSVNNLLLGHLHPHTCKHPFSLNLAAGFALLG